MTKANLPLEAGLGFELAELVRILIKTQAADLRRAAARLDEANSAIVMEEFDTAAKAYRQNSELIANQRKLAAYTLFALEGLRLSTMVESNR